MPEKKPVDPFAALEAQAAERDKERQEQEKRQRPLNNWPKGKHLAAMVAAPKLVKTKYGECVLVEYVLLNPDDRQPRTGEALVSVAYASAIDVLRTIPEAGEFVFRYEGKDQNGHHDLLVVRV